MSLLFEQSRDASLEFVANCAEAIHHLRRSDCAPAPRTCQEPSDFLYDYTSLTLGYLNQLARLGSGYTLLPARILERVVASYTPCGPAEHRASALCTETREIGGGGKATFEIKVKNSGGQTATGRFLVPKFRDGRGNEVKGLRVQVTCRAKEYTDDFEADVDAGLPLTLSIEVEAKGKLEPQRKLVGRLDMLVGTQPPCSMLLVLHTK